MNLRLQLVLCAAFLFTVTLNAEPDCTVEGLTRGCKELSAHGWTQYIKLSDGTWFRNPEYDNSLMKNIYQSNIAPASVSTERQDKIRELVDFARQTLIDELQAGRPLDKLPPEVKNQIGRLRHVHYNYDESVKDRTTTCATGSPNAYFRPKLNSMTLCRSSMMLPNAGLIAVIGHELCHAIDPCNLTFQYSTEPALATERLPYSTQLNCFRERGLADDYPLSKDDFVKAALKFSDSGAAQEQILSTANVVKEHPSCFSILNGKNPGVESIPDLCAGRVAAKYLKAHPPKSALERLAVLTPFVDRLCGPPVVEAHKEGHMATRDRINKIYLSDPEMSAALGCNAVISSCLHPAPTVIATPKDGAATR